MHEITKLFNSVKKDITLSDFTTWRIGGKARYFLEPTLDELPSILQFCDSNSIKVYFLGRGSNTLISSSGLNGLVICTKKALKKIEFKDGIITAEAGVPMPSLSKFAANLGWGGYEYLIGIPGNIGAGITINAGLTAKGRKEIKDVLIEVQLMDSRGRTWWESVDELGLGYRTSNIPKRNLFVLRANFKSTYISSKEEIKHKTALHLADRRRKQPLSKPTAGSTFKQPEGGKPAGWYIEQTGLKGFRIGGALVSKKHANWIENCGDATSEDILNLIEHIKSSVYDKFNILLKEEVIYLR
ncbi:MAG: UDP-N-acetylmuramate dehydrogenase [Balneolaceae bacterium]